MVVLHIASISNSPFSGVSVVVPQHVLAQSIISDVALININNETIENVPHQFEFNKHFNLEDYPSPFNRPDLVVFHEVYHVEFTIIAHYLRKNKIPYIIIPHGCLTDEAQHKKWLKKRAGNVLLFNRFICGAKAIQCLSQSEADCTNFNCPKFIGTNGIRIPEEHKNSFHQDFVRFLYIGRLEEKIKGLDLMIEAVHLNAAFMRKEKCVLDIYGPSDNNDQSRINSLISQNGVEDIVKTHPGITGKEKQKQLLDSDVFIQTSRSEGMPTGILEALSYGLPCLITEGTRLGQIVADSDVGWVAETNAQSIAEQIKNAILDKKCWEKKSEKAVQLIKNEFSWDGIEKDTIYYYGKFIAC